MAHNEKKGLANTFEQGKFSEDIPVNSELPTEEKEPVEHADRDDQLTAGKGTPEITANDGSITETLDTAFHGTPGWSEGENISGSNHAGYYGAQSDDKNDTEEELDYLRERKQSGEGNTGKE